MTRGGDPDASRMRKQAFRLLETAKDHDVASRVVDSCLIGLILLSVGAVVAESIPTLERRYAPFFFWLEIATLSIFSVEYLLRVWSCIEDPAAFRHSSIRFRFRYMVSFHPIVDLLSILPLYLLLFGAPGLADLRLLRAVRLMRILKLTRYFAPLNMLILALKDNGMALLASFMILITTMLFAASGMYFFERSAQPVDFGSIPAAMWWAFATLTTVGYGDVTPVTVGGKVFGAMITVIGIGMVALPTSILATGYSAQLKENKKRYRARAADALDDGILSRDEIQSLETLRLDLGLSKHTASQILDEGMVTAALEQQGQSCPHCGRRID